MGEYGAVMRDEEVPLIVKHLGRCVEYEPTWRAMQAFTATRTPDTPDELWLLEHSPVYTLGQAGKPEHLLRSTAIPVIHIDRGGQITYHGPGQLVLYTLIDLRRRGYGIRDLVRRIEQAVIGWLETQNIVGDRLSGAPGVYVNGAKIAALGLRVKHGCTYHGLALNLDMDLTPFLAINPCGFAGMVVTDCRSEHADFTPVEPGLALAAMLKRELCRQPILGGGHAGYS